jgi:hypothetical protein
MIAAKEVVVEGCKIRAGQKCRRQTPCALLIKSAESAESAVQKLLDVQPVARERAPTGSRGFSKRARARVLAGA